MVMTVNGTILSSEMGVTLSHEHVMVDWIGADSTGYHRWDRTEVVERVLPYFQEITGHGVQAFIDFTPAYLGRDPFILQELSQRTGLQIITNTGYYGAVENRFIPEYAYEESAEQLANRWIDEFENGIDGSELRPGFIKISVASNKPLSELHGKIVEAAAIAHLETGMTIASHTIGGRPAVEQVELLKSLGISPEAWIWTHAQSGSLETNLWAAREGAWISLDNVHHNPQLTAGEKGSIEWYAERITELKQAGHIEQILISHDAGWYSVGEPNGGDFRGYTDLFDYLIPELLNNGFTGEDVEQLFIKNPQRAFEIRLRTAGKGEIGGHDRDRGWRSGSSLEPIPGNDSPDISTSSGMHRDPF